ncbi:MAG: TraR/DksA C4-type zinc finger protein [Anaerolineae bacterium]|nr:TraR/DksA C4-type zinc finger protein [Chloroflexota bacterium]MBP6297895.1 TraR/DksA C4-type zinc finger protein [Anaerolineae bacterium]
MHDSGSVLPEALDTAEVLKLLLQKTAARHNHLCPRQVLGVRMGMLAGQLLELRLPQAEKRLLTLVETDGCFADGVAVATGCEIGHRTLRLIDFGKVAATFIDTQTHHSIRIAPHNESRRRAERYNDGTLSNWRAYLNAYQVMPDEELFTVERVNVQFSIDALVSEPGYRVNCGQCGEEIINHREILIDGHPLCRACAGQAYYSLCQEEYGELLSPIVLGSVT